MTGWSRRKSNDCSRIPITQPAPNGAFVLLYLVFQTLESFEKEIQRTIHPDLNIRINKRGAPDVAGIHRGNVSLGSVVSSKGILDRPDSNFTDINGIAWRPKDQIIRHIKAKMCAINIKIDDA